MFQSAQVRRWPILLAAVLVLLGLAGPAQAATLFVGLTDDNKLQKFPSSGSLGALIPITGLQSGENVVGIDFRPQTGQLYGLGSTSRLYTINTTTGAATQVGSAGAFTLSGTDFGVDFNPVVDRLRVVSDADQNMRLNPVDGTLTAPDDPLQYPGGTPNPNVVGSAYTNNFLGATSTTLYGIDSGQDTLVIQNPPNSGILQTVGPLGFNFTGPTGFDILDDGTAWLSLPGTSSSTIFNVDLATGQSTVVRTLPVRLRGLAGQPSGVAGPVTGELNRGVDNVTETFFKNEGSRPIEFLRVELLDGYTADQASIVSGPQAGCTPSGSTVGCGPFSGPGFWAPGQELRIQLHTTQFYPDNSGGRLFVCAAPCSPFFIDAGPFAFGGPAPPVVPPPDGGGGGDGGGEVFDEFDFNHDGKVDHSDIDGFVDALVNAKGFRHDLKGPDQSALINKFVEKITAPRPSGSALAARRKPIVLGRLKTSVQSGKTKRVRVPLTKAGKRFLRSYKRKRLRVTVTLKVERVPASGESQTRTFKRKVTFRVKRPRR